jgi:probable rRNA maturation factor
MPEDEPITILIDDPFLPLVDTEALRTVVARALTAEGQPDGELTLVITDDTQVQELNQTYRGLDEPTDVLSFAAQESQPDADGVNFVSAPEAARYLGDIIIAFPYAAANAAAQGRAVRDELALLAVHGTLHLLGYDHGSAEEEEVMWAHQAQILAGA